MFTVSLNFILCCTLMIYADRCYIPLLRAADNTAQPIIGTPWSPELSESLSLIQRHMRSPKDPVMTVTAFAGPLSPSKASPLKFILDYFFFFFFSSKLPMIV